MREIKYKAYIRHLELMVHVIEINFYTDEITCWLTSPEEGDPSVFHFSEIELIQFTGLHDKNGKEICEGDNLRVIETHLDEIVYESATVLYSERYAEFRLVGANPLSYYVSSYHAFEIIGNIYENMEKGK
jgi:uncharacterized phage protein (TIGR01671 family)